MKKRLLIMPLLLALICGCTTSSRGSTPTPLPSTDTQSTATNLPWSRPISEYYDEINEFINWLDQAENHAVSSLEKDGQEVLGNRFYGYEMIDGQQHWYIQLSHQDPDDHQTYLTLTELTADQGWNYEIVDQKSKLYNGVTGGYAPKLELVSMMDYEFIDPSKIIKFAVVYPVADTDPIYFSVTNDFGTSNYVVEYPTIDEFNFKRLSNLSIPLPNEVWYE